MKKSPVQLGNEPYLGGLVHRHFLTFGGRL